MRNYPSIYSENYSSDEMSVRAYNLLIGAILLWGFAINAFMCANYTAVFQSWDLTVVLIGYFVIGFAGINISASSSNAFVSFIGYNMVVVPIGVVLSLGLAQMDLTGYQLMNTLYTTAGLTIFMMLIATFFPGVFDDFGKILFFILLGIVVVEFIMIFAGFEEPTWWDLGVAFVFCLYIGYDWGKAQEQPRTADNAVDACVNLYLDIINLFIRLASASSKSSRRRK